MMDFQYPSHSIEVGDYVNFKTTESGKERRYNRKRVEAVYFDNYHEEYCDIRICNRKSAKHIPVSAVVLDNRFFCRDGVELKVGDKVQYYDKWYGYVDGEVDSFIFKPERTCVVRSKTFGLSYHTKCDKIWLTPKPGLESLEAVEKAIKTLEQMSSSCSPLESDAIELAVEALKNQRNTLKKDG